MEAIRRIVFRDEESKDYVRVYSNNAYVQPAPRAEGILIDFYEEYPVPVLINEQLIDEEGEVENKYNDIPNEILVHRERKCSVVLTKDQALKIVDIILTAVADEEDE